MTKQKYNAALRVLVQAILLVGALAILMASLGCQTVPKDPPKPPADIAKEAGCPEPQPLHIPAALSSVQLEELLAAAYYDMRAQYIACRAGH